MCRDIGDTVASGSRGAECVAVGGRACANGGLWKWARIACGGTESGDSRDVVDGLVCRFEHVSARVRARCVMSH